MAQSSTEPKFSLRLIIDEEKNKVVLAEAGTIVRLLAKHRKSDPVTIGCLRNLYTSVVDMELDDFETDACKQMLLYPKNIREAQYRNFKLNIDTNESLKCFGCRFFSICRMCSNFNTSLCKCGKLMNEEISFLEYEENDVEGVFMRDKSSFIITDDLRLTDDSTSSLLQTLKDLGCADVSKLREQVLDIGLKEVMTLMQCVFTSNTPLTDAFLKNQSSNTVRKIYRKLSDDKGDEAEPDKVITIDAIVRKQDMKILYVECGEDFVDLLFTFLAIPLESIWEISGNSITIGRIGNLFRSFKDLSDNEVLSASKCMIPYYYRCQKQLLKIRTPTPRVYLGHCYSKTLSYSQSFYLTTKRTTKRMTFVDPKSDCCGRSKDGKGFVKRGTKFIVSDDLIVTPKISSSTFSVLKKFQILTDDLEVQAITISNADALNLLGASLVTSSALSSAFGNLIVKKPKEENVSWNPVSKKPKVET
ncbi:putative protein [Arabidopsis thaliana]|uniref:Uncharacterized protein F7J8_120 n=1 Tax=Arabidopsis thaliana TaxID=3702 RepID=Q9LFC2_ARATH|nr:hypothetical protein (DUF674) [Arabidopsis thaliana]AED90303.1 hypothetical protein (DUF674) [Arabidopsis thaliana]CAB69842.1 putative protein [Arabidopsis thaliana]|eukprot:NP_195734.1 hypothetical protein (DUF674) [Arabidopsis thaliana]